jgi:putative transposase
LLFLHTTRFTRGKLPHWEVESGRYFVTVRLADSLPQSVIDRLRDTHTALSAISPSSTAFLSLQRLYFLTLEKHLSAGAGACVLSDPKFAQLVVNEFHALAEFGVGFPHYSIMPNHWHALITAADSCTLPLPVIMKRVKGRTGKRIRALTGGSGPVWQREWFDHRMRNEAETQRTIAYIQNNPVKAGMVADWRQHPYTK